MKISHKISKVYFDKIQDNVKCCELRVFDEEKHSNVSVGDELELICDDETLEIDIAEIRIINNPIEWCLENSYFIANTIFIKDITRGTVYTNNLASKRNIEYIEKIKNAIGEFTNDNKLILFFW